MPRNPSDAPAPEYDEAPPVPVAPPEPEPAPVDATPEPESDDGLVAGRWVSPQAAYNPEQGLIRYGDAVRVTPEQIEDDASTVVAWSEDWQPDPDLQAQREAADAALRSDA